MRRQSGFLLLLFVVAAITARAEAQDDKVMVTKVLNDYGAAFSSLDPLRVVPYYHRAPDARAKRPR